MVTAHRTTGTSATEQLLQAKMANIIVLPEGALTTDNAEDRAAIGWLKGLGLNLSALPREILYQLQDGTTTELCARKGRTVQMLSERRINIEQLSL